MRATARPQRHRRTSTPFPSGQCVTIPRTRPGATVSTSSSSRHATS